MTREIQERIADTPSANFWNRIDSKLGVLSRSVDAKDFASKDVENYIRDQLQNLRTEILKYDEVSIEYEKARQTNDHLTKQLQAQKEHHEKLDGRVKSLLHSEITLKSRSSQLEMELNTLKNISCDRNSEPSVLEREAVALRSQLRKAEEDLQVAVDKLNKVEEVRGKEESEAAGWKVRLYLPNNHADY
jgi:chromosome segregation ATPase